MNYNVSFKCSDVSVDVMLIAFLFRVDELVLEDFDACLVFSDAVLGDGTYLSSSTKMVKIDGSVLPEGDVHLCDVLESIDV